MTPWLINCEGNARRVGTRLLFYSCIVFCDLYDCNEPKLCIIERTYSKYDDFLEFRIISSLIWHIEYCGDVYQKWGEGEFQVTNRSLGRGRGRGKGRVNPPLHWRGWKVWGLCWAFKCSEAMRASVDIIGTRDDAYYMVGFFEGGLLHTIGVSNRALRICIYICIYIWCVIICIYIYI